MQTRKEERRQHDALARQDATQFIADTTNGGPKGKGTGRGTLAPTRLEMQVREYLSTLNREERRTWTARQSAEAGKIRKQVLTQ